MKLQDLDSKLQARQSQRVFESYFGKQFSFENIAPKQATAMLTKVRGLLDEHRATPNFHHSEKNPTYLKLMVMERVLSARVNETPSAPMGATGSAGATAPGAQDKALATGASKIANATGQTGQGAKVAKALDIASQGKPLDQTSRNVLAQQASGLEKVLSDPTQANRLQQMLKTATGSQSMAENRGRRGQRLTEAELQQAQVVLAAQDMIDRVQKMVEEISDMQFKDLAALVDSIRNEVGMDQATQFNGAATAALQGLVQNLQGSKQQLESAQGILTGQAPQVPGEAPVDPNADLGLDANLPADADAELPAEEPEELPTKALGRERR
jgi:hypothetical protein